MSRAGRDAADSSGPGRNRRVDSASEAVAPPAATDPAVVYTEDGWSWAWIFAAPLVCAAAGAFEWLTGAPIHWLMLSVCALATAACHAVMIAATRIHGRVRLTDSTYWQGTEELPLELVAGVLPEPVEGSRLLGELREVPRRRGEVGLLLTSDTAVRAYARHPEALATAFAAHVGRASAPEWMVSAAGAADDAEGTSPQNPLHDNFLDDDEREHDT